MFLCIPRMLLSIFPVLFFLIHKTMARGGDGQGQQAGPLDPLAQAIGVHDRFVKIPGALGLPEKEVPLIYLMVAALMVSERGGEGERSELLCS